MKFSKQFKSLKLKTSCFFLVHWWLKGLISIWNGCGKWCSICWDTEPFTFVNASWIYITNIFYKRRLHSLLSAWVVLKMVTLKEANNFLLWNLHAFFCCHSEFVTHILFAKAFATITMVNKMANPCIGPDRIQSHARRIEITWIVPMEFTIVASTSIQYTHKFTTKFTLNRQVCSDNLKKFPGIFHRSHAENYYYLPLMKL